MKRHFTFSYGGEEIEVAAWREGDTVTIERGGETYTVTINSETSAESGTSSMPGGQSGGPQQSAGSSQGSLGQKSSGGLSPSFSSSPSASASGETGEVPAPMTGVIKEILVSEGDTVAEGEKVMVMEAMKMDIEVFAYTAGTVKAINVQVNDSVSEGQPLVRIG